MTRLLGEAASVRTRLVPLSCTLIFISACQGKSYEVPSGGDTDEYSDPSQSDGAGGDAQVQGSGGGPSSPQNSDWEDCNFDPGLEMSIQRALAESGHRSRFELSELYVYQDPFASLAGIECLENLEQLSLSYDFSEGEHPTIDLAPLSGLKFLSELRVSNIAFTHLESLAEGPLRRLALSWADLDSLEPLRALSQLNFLELSGIEVSDLSALSKLESLRGLTLEYMPVSNLAPLSGLPALNTLTLGTLELENLQGLSNLPQLGSLRFTANEFTSFKGIANVPQLRSLLLEGCDQVESFDGLEACHGLQSIEVQSFYALGPTIIGDLDALGEVRTLKSLDLAGAQIADIRALSTCTELEYLNLDDNQVADLSPLSGMGLTTLRVSRNPIASIEALGTLTSLRELGIEGLGVDSIEALKNLPITRFYASKNAISDLEPTSSWVLEQLSLANNAIVELPPGFVGGQGAYSLTDLTENPLNAAAIARLEVLCETYKRGLPGYLWDEGGCYADYLTP